MSSRQAATPVPAEDVRPAAQAGRAHPGTRKQTSGKQRGASSGTPLFCCPATGARYGDPLELAQPARVENELALLHVPAPMTGTILEINVTSGQTVAEGDELIVVESMKMEIPIESPAAGTVEEILVAVRDHIDEGALLLRLETA